MERKPKRIKQSSNSPISLSSMNDPSSSHIDAASLPSIRNRSSASPERYSLRKRGGFQEQDNTSRIVSSPPPLPAAGAATTSMTDDTFQNNGSRRSLKRRQQHQQQTEASSSSSPVTTGQNVQHGENTLSHHPNKKRKSKKTNSKGKNKASPGHSNKLDDVESTSSAVAHAITTSDNNNTMEQMGKGKERAIVAVNSNTSINSTTRYKIKEGRERKEKGKI
ncbi:hypothetical protein BDA99DRAFT_175860 [Phascolomyces articulosus]|uniref:Uncharacterized protein n=1 Tax=Phascolomyces articulosus TaxID=60185 RepID=A0AAD5K6E7_9FUNG|nr:hypothetical protein BDA99DRAFT_175860 [Phascolomyces articulosus]